MKVLNKFFIFLLSLYKRFISPMLGDHCRFYPTCSEYAIEAFSKLPFFKAFLKTIWRVLRCHPFHPGGYDPLEKDERLCKCNTQSKNTKQGEC